MAPTLEVMRLTGAASGLGATTNTNITSAVNLADASDSASDAGANPITVPGSGSNYSYWVTTQLNVTVAAPDLVFNLSVSPGVNSSPGGTGVDCRGGITNSGAQYVQATGTAGTTGTELTTGNYAAVATVYSSIFTSIGTGGISVQGTQASTGQFGGYFVYQISVASTASAGYLPNWTSANFTNTWSYSYN